MIVISSNNQQTRERKVFIEKDIHTHIKPLQWMQLYEEK